MKPSRTPEARKAHRLALKEKGLCVHECGRSATIGVSCEPCAVLVRGRANQTHAHRKTSGLCISCGKRPPIEAKRKCAACVASVKRQRQEIGLCGYGCGEPTVPGCFGCQKCLDRKRQVKQQLLDRGLCVSHCGRPATPGKQKCSTCSIKSVLRQSVTYAKQRGYTPITMPVDQFVVWYSAKLEAAKGCCEWCGEPFGKRLIVDHDHATGEPRALLCIRCNVAEGYGLQRLERVVAAMRAWAARPRPRSTSTSS